MTNHTAFNQGMNTAARAHDADRQPDIFATDAEVDAWVKRQEALRRALTIYQEPPPLEAHYITRPTTAQDVSPYATPGEAAAEFVDGVFGLVVHYGKPVTAIAILGGMGWLVVAFFQGLVGGVIAFGAAIGSFGGVAFAVVVVLALLSGLKGDGERKSPPAQSAGGTTQNINVVVNVAGGNVTTTTNGK